jgi:hypothetical protein
MWSDTGTRLSEAIRYERYDTSEAIRYDTIRAKRYERSDTIRYDTIRYERYDTSDVENVAHGSRGGYVRPGGGGAYIYNPM